MNFEVVRVIKIEFVYLSKVSLVFKFFDLLYFVFYWIFWEINIECLNDGVDFFFLFGGEGRDWVFFKGDDLVVLMCIIEVFN